MTVRKKLLGLAGMLFLSILLSVAVTGDDRMQIIPAIYCRGETYVELEYKTYSFQPTHGEEVLGTVSDSCRSDRMPVREFQTNDPSLLNYICYLSFGDSPVNIDVKNPDVDTYRAFVSYKHWDQYVSPSVCFDGHVYMQSRYTFDDFAEIKERYRFHHCDWRAERCYPFTGPDKWTQGDTNYEFLLDANFYRSELTDEIIYAVAWVHGRKTTIRFVRQEGNDTEWPIHESEQLPKAKIRLNGKSYQLRGPALQSGNADPMIKEGDYRLRPQTAAITEAVGIDQVPEKEGSTNYKNLVGTTAQFLLDNEGTEFFWIERINYKGYREYLIFYPEDAPQFQPLTAAK